MNPANGYAIAKTNDTGRQSTASLGQIMARCLVIGLGYAVVTLVMGVMLLLDAGNGLVTAFVLLTLGGTLLALVLSPAIRHLPLARMQRVAVLWAVLFLVGYPINALEAMFFTTLSPGQLIGQGVRVLGTSFIVAWLFDWLFPAQPPTASLGRRLREMLARRSWLSWLGRLVLCSLAYVLVYLVVGAVFYLAFTQPYYTDPALAEQLQLRAPPDFGVILPLEIVRGLLFALVLLPLIATVRLGRRWLAVWLGLILFVAGALVSLLVNRSWPIPLRVYHGVEIFFQNFTLGLVIGYLLHSE